MSMSTRLLAFVCRLPTISMCCLSSQTPQLMRLAIMATFIHSIRTALTVRASPTASRPAIALFAESGLPIPSVHAQVSSPIRLPLPHLLLLRVHLPPPLLLRLRLLRPLTDEPREERGGYPGKILRSTNNILIT